MTYISTRSEQFAYFDAVLDRPDWTGKRVLDFGGNVGNILRDPGVPIEVDKYWCIDVSRDAVAEGQRRYPAAHFHLYDRYNFEFNPTGTPGLPIPDLGVRFDIILSYSVFTHTSQAEMVEAVDRLRTFLVPGGMLAFTFIDPRWTPPPGWARETEFPDVSNLHWRLERRREINPDAKVDITRVLTRAATAELTYVTLVNDDELYVDPHEDGVDPTKPNLGYHTFCTTEHLHHLFPDAQVVPPAPPERQHCAVIRTTP